jgi:hypothetical protein
MRVLPIIAACGLPVKFSAAAILEVSSATDKNPDSESLQSLTYSILSILEREEAFAGMLKELVSKIMPIGYQAVEVATEIIALAALEKVYTKVSEHEGTLTKFEKAVNEMIATTVGELTTVVQPMAETLTGKGESVLSGSRENLMN